MKYGLVMLVALAGCGGTAPADASVPREDAARDAAIDAAPGDAGIDAAVEDAGEEDAALDAAATDAGAPDAATADDGGLDAGGPTIDAAIADGATVDAGPFDFPDGAACATSVTADTLQLSSHVEQCSAIDYINDPPSSGPHYGTWPAYQTYPAPIADGFIVHGLEHGAVSIRYRCDTPCDAELAALEAYLAWRPADPRCTATRHQIIVSPDPTLATRFAATSWAFTLRSGCFDLAALDAFLDEHLAHAPENTCSNGVDVLDPASGIPAGCGL